MNVLVTGAGGWLGREVCGRLQREGHRVLALDRGGLSQERWEKVLLADIATDEVVSGRIIRSAAGAEVIIHCAGYAHRSRETSLDVTRFWSINRDGTGRILELAKQVGAVRFVYLSSIAFYDWSVAGARDEDSRLDAPTAYAGSKLAGERLCVDSGLDWRVARLGTVFGTGDRANFAKLAVAQARRRFVVPGRGEAAKSVLPVGLAAELLVDLALRPEVPHRLVNLALPQPVALGEICASFADFCGFPRAPVVPEQLLRLLALVGDKLERVRPGVGLTTRNLNKLMTSTVVDTCRMQQNWPGRDWGDFRRWLAQSADYYRKLV
jgi:nucleoside-diphosphate-sugar epimerase